MQGKKKKKIKEVELSIKFYLLESNKQEKFIYLIKYWFGHSKNVKRKENSAVYASSVHNSFKNKV